MWDYNKLFAEGNIVGLLYPDGEIVPIPCKFRKTSNIENLNKYYGNENLSCEEYKIQYIIRLDEHGNVVEKLFDRERDIPPSMPELKHGMIIKINYKDKETLGYVDKHRGLVVYQDGTYDTIDSHKDWIETDIVAIYDDVECFNQCDRYDPIWEKSN